MGGAFSSNCPIGDPDAPPPPCNYTKTPPVHTYIQKPQLTGSQTGNVFDTSLNRTGIQPVHS